jgi:ribosome-associated protein
MPAGEPWQKPAPHHAGRRTARRWCGWPSPGRAGLRAGPLRTLRSGPSYTAGHRACQLQAAEPGATVVPRSSAQDQYAGLHTWRDWRELLGRVTLAVANRPGPMHSRPTPTCFAFAAPRQRAAADARHRRPPTSARASPQGRGRSTRWCPPAWRRYIDHHLYQRPPRPTGPLNGHPQAATRHRRRARRREGPAHRVFNTEHLSPLFERVIVASGTSNRQTKALAASVRDAVKARAVWPCPAHRGRGQRRMDHRRLRCRGGPHHAAGHPRVLPPRGDLGRQAGQAEDRRHAGARWCPRLPRSPRQAKAAAKKAAARRALPPRPPPARQVAAKSAPKASWRSLGNHARRPGSRRLPSVAGRQARAPAKKSAPAKSAPPKTVVAVKPAAKKAVAPRKPVTAQRRREGSAAGQEGPAGKRAKAEAR